jgi:hypothetical protein
MADISVCRVVEDLPTERGMLDEVGWKKDERKHLKASHVLYKESGRQSIYLCQLRQHFLHEMEKRLGTGVFCALCTRIKDCIRLTSGRKKP